MTRYKGRQNAKAVERDFPHFVDTVSGAYFMTLAPVAQICVSPLNLA